MRGFAIRPRFRGVVCGLSTWHKERLEAASRRFSSLLREVEMRGSRTPCPGKPIDEYTTGLVDDLLIRPGLPSAGFPGAGPLVLDGD